MIFTDHAYVIVPVPYVTLVSLYLSPDTLCKQLYQRLFVMIFVIV